MPKINVFFIPGWDPPTRTSRQNVAAAICHVDRQNVAWPAVRGHRRRHTHKLRKNNRCDTFVNIIFQLKMRDSDIVNLTNGGKNGINIRLQNSRYRRMDRGTNGKSFKILFSNDVNWNDRNFRRNYRRGLSEVQNKGETRRFQFQREAAAARVLQLPGQLQRFKDQRRFREETCLVEPIGEINCPGYPVRRYGTRRCDPWIIILDSSLLLSLQLSTVKPTVDMTKTGTLSDGSWIECLILSRTTTGLKKVPGKKLRLLTDITAKKFKFPLTTWASNRPGFFMYIKYKRNKEQAQVL